MCALVYVCQHPTSVSMYPCPLCQPFGTLGCFFPWLEAGASHWSYSRSRAAFPTDSLLGIHRFFPFSSFFFPPVFQSPPCSRCGPWLGLRCHLASRSRQAGKERPAPWEKCFSAASCGSAAFKKPDQQTITPPTPSKKKTNKRREAQGHCRHLPESWSCLLGKGFYWMFCVPYYNYH